MASFHDPQLNNLSVSVPSCRTNDTTVLYSLRVGVGDHHHWTVEHRYSDFVQLHARLTAEQQLAQLPPKKLLGNRDPQFVETRRCQLQQYLQSLLDGLHARLPLCLADFLALSTHDAAWMLRRLACERRCVGGDSVTTLTPPPLHVLACLLEQRRLESFFTDADTSTTDESQRSDTDTPTTTTTTTQLVQTLMHELQQAKRVHVAGDWPTSDTAADGVQRRANCWRVPVWLFGGVSELVLRRVRAELVEGLGQLRPTLSRLSVIDAGVTSLAQLLRQTAAASSSPQSAGIEPCLEWPLLTYLCVSDNYITQLDDEVLLAPRLTCLDISSNSLTYVTHRMRQLPALSCVDLSSNRLRNMQQMMTALPSGITDVQLSGNQLTMLPNSPSTCDGHDATSVDKRWFSRLCRLQRLDLSFNKLLSVEPLIEQLQHAPSLCELSLIGNPAQLTAGPDYRARLLQLLLWSRPRGAHLILDSEHSTCDEVAMVAVRRSLALTDPTPARHRAVRIPAFLERAWRHSVVNTL